jgi:hypothetical protein
MGTRHLRQTGLSTSLRAGGWCSQRASRFQSLGTALQRPPLTRQNVKRTSRIVAQQTSTAYDVVYTSDAPYYVREQQKSMLQKITVVKVSSTAQVMRTPELSFCDCTIWTVKCSLQTTM